MVLPGGAWDVGGLEASQLLCLLCCLFWAEGGRQRQCGSVVLYCVLCGAVGYGIPPTHPLGFPTLDSLLLTPTLDSYS